MRPPAKTPGAGGQDGPREDGAPKTAPRGGRLRTSDAVFALGGIATGARRVVLISVLRAASPSDYFSLSLLTLLA